MNSSNIKITLVEDNPNFRLELVHQLEHLNYQIKGVGNAKQLDKLREMWPSDIYILDINLPGENGFSIAKRIFNPNKLGIIMLSARTDISDKIQGLEESADFYLTKPIDWRELNACIRSIYRRLSPIKPQNWVLNTQTNILISIKSDLLHLTKSDTKLLLALLEKPGKIVTRGQIGEALDFKSQKQSDYRLNTIICRLREKLADFDSELSIQTFRGTGYAFIGPKIEIKPEDGINPSL